MEEIRIQSNVSSGLIFRTEKRKEELKKASEEENLKIYGHRFPSEWMKSHRQDYIDGKYSGYKYNEYNVDYSDMCNIIFYQWSNTDFKNLKNFYRISTFLDFCKECNIEVSESCKAEFKRTNYVYATCIPGKSVLIVNSSLYSLEYALDSYKRRAEDIPV